MKITEIPLPRHLKATAETESGLEVTATCPWCKSQNVITVQLDNIVEWQTGTLVQDAFPYLNTDQRELLITGICSKCWDTMK